MCPMQLFREAACEMLLNQDIGIFIFLYIVLQARCTVPALYFCADDWAKEKVRRNCFRLTIDFLL